MPSSVMRLLELGLGERDEVSARSWRRRAEDVLDDANEQVRERLVARAEECGYQRRKQRQRVVVEAHQQASGERSTHDLAARQAWCVALLPARANAPAGARTHVPTWPDSRFAIVYVVSHDESRFRCSGRAELLAPPSDARSRERVPSLLLAQSRSLAVTLSLLSLLCIQKKKFLGEFLYCRR